MKCRCRIAAKMLLSLRILYRSSLYPFFLGLILVPAGMASAALPDGFASRDIGDEGLPGSADLSGMTWTVNGSGHDIGDEADDFHFCYMQISGDTEIIARVVGITGGAHEWRKAGVVIRETLADNSSHAFMAMTNPAGTEHAAAYQSRADGNNNITYLTPTGYSSMPWWVRLERYDNTFTGSVSPDGVVWTDVNTTQIVMADDVYIGLAVTSHDNAQIATGTFDNVLINGPWPTCSAWRPYPENGSIAPAECDGNNVYMFLGFMPGPCSYGYWCKGYFSDSKPDVDSRDEAHSLGTIPNWPSFTEGSDFVVGYDDPTVPEFARAPLVPGKTYYWCVDSWDGSQYWPGPTWSFTPILEYAWGPSPADGEEWVWYMGTMTWNPGSVDTTGYILSYDIYIGTDHNDVNDATTASPEYTANVTTESYDYDNLEYETEYFWRVDTVLMVARPPFFKTYYTGDVWSFSVVRREGPITVGLGPGYDFGTIQEAVNVSNDSDIIIVADAVYRGDGNRDIDFKGKAITVRSENGPENCIIDCNGTQTEPHRGFYFHSSEDANSVVDGFTITNGYGLEGPYASGTAFYGGAIDCNSSGPTITDCIITGNKATYGAGIFAEGNSSPLIANCTINRNAGVSTHGGGIYCWRGATATITDSNVSYNDGIGIYFMGASAPSEITNCKITNNGREGINCGRGDIDNCIISQNGDRGIRCRVHDNEAATISNCLITGNTTCDEGGGIRTSAVDDGIIAITNCTITANIALDDYCVSGLGNGGGICCALGETVLSNSIIWGNTASGNGPDIYIYKYPPPPKTNWPEGPTELTVSYSLIGETSVGPDADLILGDGIIDDDPCFADPGYWDPNGTAGDANDDFFVPGDWHVKSQAGRYDPTTETWVYDDATSPCIDAGDPMSPIGYEPFPNGGLVNIGAYGGTLQASKSYFGKPPCETIVTGDVNGDCVVNFTDFMIMALHWCQDHNPYVR